MRGGPRLGLNAMCCYYYNVDDRLVVYEAEGMSWSAIGTFMQSSDGDAGQPGSVLYVSVTGTHCILIFNRLSRIVSVFSTACSIGRPHITPAGPISNFSFAWPRG